MQDVLETLIAQRDRLNQAIAVLQGEGDTTEPVRRRGRPKGSGKKAAKKKGRRSFTPEQRAAQAEKMRAYWAARRKGKK